MIAAGCQSGACIRVVGKVRGGLSDRDCVGFPRPHSGDPLAAAQARPAGPTEWASKETFVCMRRARNSFAVRQFDRGQASQIDDDVADRL